MNIQHLDIALIQKAVDEEVGLLCGNIAVAATHNERYALAETMSIVLRIDIELERMRKRGIVAFDPDVLIHARLEENPRIASEDIKELSHECRRWILKHRGDLKGKHPEIGPYKRRRSA